MDRQSPTSAIGSGQSVDIDAVLCTAVNSADLKMFAAEPAPLHHIGFTGILVPDEVTEPGRDALTALGESGLSIHDVDLRNPALVIPGGQFNGAEVWNALESNPEFTNGSDLSAESPTIRSQNEANTLLQMAVRPIPIVPISSQLVYSNSFREQRELLRSLVFWRKRFDIARHQPKLVHAGEDGLLIFIVDSWLVTVNQNPEEATIDLGSHGTMWLMLGTQRDVHLHGSMLVLPPFSGAIVANELAR